MGMLNSPQLQLNKGNRPILIAQSFGSGFLPICELANLQRGLLRPKMGKFLYALWLISPQICKLQILHNMNLSIDVNFGACQSGGVCLICYGVQAVCLPHIPHTKSPTAPIWNIFNGEKRHCNKNERKRLSGLCFYEDLSHFPVEVTTLVLTCTMCMLNPVYLSTQSDPHKTGHRLG